MLKKVLTITAPLVVILAVVLGLLSISSGSRTSIQPLGYNHQAHVETAGLNCIDCHQHVEKLASAGIPSIETCQTCHTDSPLSESPEEKKLLEYISEGKEIPWIRIYKVPDHVYFSHRRHVLGGELECSECHGNVAEMTKPISSPAVPASMDNCMNCHRQRNVTNDCLTCHR